MLVTPAIRRSRLFSNMRDDQIEDCLFCSGAATKWYQKGEVIFQQWDEPKSVLILLSGEVSICHDIPSGKTVIVASFGDPGELFGEVYAFLAKNEYEHYAAAASEAEVLVIPRTFLYRTCAKGCRHHEDLIRNMLTILAEKAYTLNRRVQLLSLPTLRHRIASLLLRKDENGGGAPSQMNREQMAAFLGVERPSLSRELMRMSKDGLIAVKGRRIEVTDLAALRSLL